MSSYNAEIRVRAKVDNSEVVKLEASMESAERKAEDLEKAVDKIGMDKAVTEDVEQAGVGMEELAQKTQKTEAAAQRMAERLAQARAEAQAAAEAANRLDEAFKNTKIHTADGRTLDWNLNEITDAATATEELQQEQESLADKCHRSAEAMQQLAEETRKVNEQTYGSDAASRWDEMSREANRYLAIMEELDSQGVSHDSEEFRAAHDMWKQAQENLNEYRKEIQNTSAEVQQLEETGPSGDALEQALTPTQNMLKLIRQSFQDLPAIFGIVKDKFFTNSSEMESQWDNLSNRAAAYKQILKELESQDIGFGDAEYDAAYIQWQQAEQAIKEYKASLLGTKKEQAGLSIDMQRISRSVKSMFRKMTVGAKGFFTSARRGGKSTNSIFKTLSSRLKGIALSLFVFNWISKGFNAMVSGMKTGFENLMGYSDDYANSVQELKNAMTTLGNSFAAAFSPIVQTVIPYLVQLVNWINSAASAVAQFIALLSGKSTFIRAKKTQDSYNKSLSGTASAADKARGALAKFDDLDVLEKQNETSGSSGTDTGNMFEEVPIDSEMKDLFEWLKEMWENADFYELGQLLGEKLKEALENIPWDSIKAAARKLGKSLATLINGFIEVEDLGYTIGNTFAQAFNTAFEFLNSFVHNLHWDSLGKFIAETLNGIFQNIDWALIKDTFVTGAKGLADAINSFTDTFDWDSISTTIANALNTLSETILTFFDTVDIHEIGTKLGQQITQTIEKIDWAGAGDALGTMAHSLLDAINASLDELDWVVIGESIRDFIMGIDWLTLLQDVGDLIAGILDGILIASFTALGGDGGALQKRWEEGKKVREQEREDFRTWASDMETEADTFVDDIKEKFSDPSMWDISIALQTIGEAWQGIAEEYIVPIIDNIKLAWEDLKTWLSETWVSIKETASEIWESVKQFFVDTWTLIQEKALEIWEHLRTKFEQKMDAIKDKTQKISDKFNEFKTTVSTVFTSVKESIVGAIEKIIGKISDFISKIQEAIQAVKDFLSSGFEKISGFFGGIFGGSGSSGISATAYSANAASYSLNDVPALASGAVIRGGNPFLAMLGDQPAGQTNVEAPLSTIEQAVENVMSRNGYGLGGAARIVLQLNGQDVGEALVDDLLSVMNRRGLDVEVLGVT